MIEVSTVTLPAFLASALVNGDTSGLSDADLPLVEAAHAYVAPGRIVSAEGEPYFARTCDLPGFHLGCDVMEYTVHTDIEG